MRRIASNLALIVCCVVAHSLFAAEPIPIALLSVATGSATLDLARPETMRPVFTAKPLPYTEEMILKLGDTAARHALVANERVAAENEHMAAVAIQADHEKWSRREDFARHELQKSDLGKAVLKVPELFCTSITNGHPFVRIGANAEGFVPVFPHATFVRLLFEEPRFNPLPPVLPNTSDVPVKVSLPVLLKVEDAAGNAIVLEKFEQISTAHNPDKLVGPALRTFLETLVAKATENAIAKLPRHLQPALCN